MNIGITGHTRGIGKAIFDHYEGLGLKVNGFSRGNGFDLKRNVSKIARIGAECDIFVNNAHFGFQQVLLLHRLSKYWWMKPNKLLICVGSIDGDIKFDSLNPYAVQKEALANAVYRLQASNAQFKLVLLKLGLVDTQMAVARREEKLSTDRVVSAVDFIISSRERMLVSEMTVLPVWG